MTRICRIVGLLLLLCAAVPLGIGAYWYRRSSRFLESAVQTRAHVVHLEKRISDDRTLYYPVLAFWDLKGREHRFHHKTGSYPPRYEIGETVSILYDPADPKNARTDSFVSIWLGPAIMGFLGLIPMVMGLFMILLAPLIIRRIGCGTHQGPGAAEGTTLPSPISGPDTAHREWGMACHLAAFCVLLGIPFGNILGPLVVWLIKRDASPLVDAQGKESMNFQISMTLYTVLSLFTCLLLVGFLLVPVILIVDGILVVVASVKADKGETFRYPFAIRLIK